MSRLTSTLDSTWLFIFQLVLMSILTLISILLLALTTNNRITSNTDAMVDTRENTNLYKKESSWIGDGEAA